MKALALLLLLSLQEGKVPWEKDWDRALLTAKKTGKPLFIYMSCD